MKYDVIIIGAGLAGMGIGSAVGRPVGGAVNR